MLPSRDTAKNPPLASAPAFQSALGADSAPGTDPVFVPEGTARSVDAIYHPPGLHWVGDGFRVHGYFNSIPNAVRRLSPFLLLDYHPAHNYSPTTEARGVGVHPHRGFETVTLAFQGSVAHHDSTGSGGVIGPGDVQWMTAASGILHKEYHEAEYARRGGAFQMAQLWVNLPRAHKMDPPRYQGLTSDTMGEVTLNEDAGQVRVVAGSYEGTRGPAQTFSPIELYHVRLKANKSATFPFPRTYNTSFLVMDGTIKVNDTSPAEKNELILFDHDGEFVRVTASTDAELLVMSGEPIDEPVVQYGPFVMNTEQEIQEAFTDFSRGKFGHLE